MLDGFAAPQDDYGNTFNLPPTREPLKSQKIPLIANEAVDIQLLRGCQMVEIQVDNGEVLMKYGEGASASDWKERFRNDDLRHFGLMGSLSEVSHLSFFTAENNVVVTLIQR